MRDDRLERWLDALLRTPGLTAITDPTEARAVHVEGSLAGLSLITEGPVADVGSGGGSPGIPLAAGLPAWRVDLIEASARKCEFLASVATEFENVTVVRARAEDWGRAAGRDAYAAVVARALAPQAVAAEWCLPLVRPGGVAVLYAGVPSEGLESVARALGAEGPEAYPVAGRTTEHLIVFRKVEATPQRFPRRPGIARKRPLGPTRNLHSGM
ncbi:MAG: RsmG family class I SAM-dependent methyltransferase [Gaiellales bacterium]